jgi:outer membrane lipoprotein-sorting protein
MKTIRIVLLACFSLSIMSFSLFEKEIQPKKKQEKVDLKKIIREAENRMRGVSSISTMKISIIRAGYTRDMTMKAWTKGDDYSLMLIKSPARDKGTTYLKRNKEIWYYIPSVERNIKMPPSMMNQSWMGTDMSNDDLVRKTSMVNDFTHSYIGTKTIDGHECYHVKLIPKEEADIVWGKIELWIDKKHYNIMKQQSFDEDLELVNTMNASAVKNMSGKIIPTVMDVIPADKPKQKTRMTYTSIKFDVEIPEYYFSTQYMSKVKP